MPDQVTTSLEQAKILVMEGQKGDPGEDGFSPAVTFEPVTVDGRTGNKMTVTDKTHPQGQNINILNGRDGSDSGGDGVFEIPVIADTSQSPTTYSTTVTAAEILAHRKNLVVTIGPGVLLTYDGFGTSVPDAGLFFFSARHFDNNVEYVVSAKIDINNINNANIVAITRQDYHFAVTPN